MSVGGASRATIMDVARLANVSKKTVSRVLNNEPRVKKETRERVLKAISELDYHPSLSARSLATHRSFLIGILFTHFGGDYLWDIQCGLMEGCETNGYSLLVQPCSRDEARALEYVKSLIRQTNVDGLILTPTIADMSSLRDYLDSVGKPYICISPRDSRHQVNEIHCDDEEGMRTLASHLIALGHQRIGFVKGLDSRRATSSRYAGFQKALVDAGLSVPEEYIVEGDFSFESGKTAGRKLLDLASRPTAIIASNDQMAAGVSFAARELGIDIPSQLSLAGYDASPFAEQAWPALTTISQPNREMAKIAADRLIALIKKEELDVIDSPLSCELIVRDSTAIPLAEC